MKTKLSCYKIVLMALLLSLPFLTAKGSENEPEYKKWESHDVRALYIEVDNQRDADLEEEDRFFQKYRRLAKGVYEVEVNEKVTSRLWKVRGTSYFMLFQYTPYLYRFDEGVLEWDGYSGTFYKKP